MCHAQLRWFFLFCAGLFVWSPWAYAASLTIGPGNDMAASIAQLFPGETLTLTNGTYSPIFISCGSNARSGTAGNPITIRAQNERQARIQGTGNTVLYIQNCSYWTVEGLYLRNVDTGSIPGFDGGGIYVDGGDHAIFRRNLVYGPNNWFNSQGIGGPMSDALFEENEVYYFARHGMINGDGGSPGVRNTFRRNYTNSRNHGDNIPSSPGYQASGGDRTRGDEGISCYPCNTSLYENNIVENNDYGLSIQAKQDTHDNQYLGNIVIDSNLAFYATARSEFTQNDINQMPRNTTYRNNVSLRNAIGLYIQTSKNAQIHNTTVIDGTNTGASINTSCGTACGEGGDGTQGFTATNLLIANTTGAALNISNQFGGWSINFTRLFSNSGGNGTTSDGNGSATNITTSNPTLGTCKVFIPSASNLKGSGLGGADIGANILNRYQDGVLTNTPLWNQSTGAFPCGATVAGVNDSMNDSCIGVHQRLNVNFNGCTLPASSSLPAPTNLRLLTITP